MSEIVRYRIPRQVKDSKQGGALIPFEPWSNATHNAKLQVKLDKWINEDQSRSGLVLAGFDRDDPDGPFALLSKPQDVDVVKTLSGDRKVVALSASQRVASSAAARKVAAYYEDQFGGNWRMTEFRPYEGEAVFEPLDGKVATARGLLASNGFKCEPWDIYVSKRRGGGFHVRLQGGITYSDKYRDGINEAIRQIAGKEGWFYDVDPQTGELDVVPGELPTFEKVYPFPMETFGSPDLYHRMPMGVRLNNPGEKGEHLLYADWKDNPFFLCVGAGGSGKSALTNNIIACAIKAGFELSIIDVKSKSSDYFWCRPWVAQWGCESLTQQAGLVQLLVKEMREGERAKAWTENGWQAWYDIPDWAKRKFPQKLIVVDEYSGTVDGYKQCRSLPKSALPGIWKSMYEAHAKYLIQSGVIDILRLARFMGYKVLLLSQSASLAAGLGPAIRDLFQMRAGMGSKMPENMRGQVFKDPRAVPFCPPNVIADKVDTGVGSVEGVGIEPCVMKGFYAGDPENGLTDTEVLGKMLVEQVGLPDGIDEARYLDTLRKHGPDEKIDVEYMRFLTNRISVPFNKALASDDVLPLIKQAWDDAKAEMAGDTGAVLEGGESPADGSKEVPIVNGQPLDSPLIDASLLAKRMEAER